MPSNLHNQILFHENFWKILSAPFGREKDVSSDLTFDFLMVLLETKSTIPKSSKFLEDLYNKTLEYEAERTGGEKASYEDCKNKHSLWGMDKLVTEFRKLFVNKTAFMSLYSEYDSVSKKFGSDLAAGYPYKPTINQKSQKLDVFLSLLSSGSLMIPLS